MGTNKARRRFVDDDGETVVGSAILFPVMLFGLFMLIQILLGYYVRAVASAAATDAAAYIAHDGVTEVDGENYARDFILDQAGGLVSAGELDVNASKGAEFTQVTVEGRTRLLWGVGLDVEASAPVERFEPQGG